MSAAFRQTFQHLVSANSLLADGSVPPPVTAAPLPPLPPLQPAPTNPPVNQQPPTVTQPPSPADEDIRIIEGRTHNSKNLINAGYRYSKDGKVLTDGRQSWRCVKRNKCHGRIYTINDTFHCLGKPHSHPPDGADVNAAAARAKIKQMASLSHSSNHNIYIVLLPERFLPVPWFVCLAKTP